MKVVIDTNVFVSSFFGGKPRTIIDLWREHTITLCLSKDILEEYIDVLHRLNLDKSLLAELLGLFSKNFNLIFTRNTPDIHVIEEDPDDDKCIACAIALKADLIVSGDKRLLKLGEYQGINILNPDEFLELNS